MNEPTSGIIRAAEKIREAWVNASYDSEHTYRFSYCLTVEAMAKIIEDETKLTDLLEAAISWRDAQYSDQIRITGNKLRVVIAKIEGK